jgi:hypothetical protein
MVADVGTEAVVGGDSPDLFRFTREEAIDWRWPQHPTPVAGVEA